ncbi:MAG: hypothetical protein CMD76_00860 [Gammaproteobacteria bacterium]|nr:hypothetical protein [Gammaproteobacteria bacterium]|tara:strand:- start:4364 stop:4975 length:612 start_codon:yes stop_codon:yes gene_type:complete
MKNIHWYFFILFYVFFFIWYTNLSGPLNDKEIKFFMKVISERAVNDEQRIERLRKFMEEDDGKDFFMVNFLDYNDTPETMPATGKGASSSNLMNYYMEYMYPEMFKRASHPVFFSDVFFPAMDIVSAEGMEDWDNVALVRYRSRKDMLQIGLNPIFDERHPYKIEALDKTIAIPVETPFLNDLRLILFILFLTLGLFIDRFRI